MSSRDTEILNRLDTVIAMLAQQGERIARLEGHLVGLPQSAEFYELKGRVEEISRRLPTSIAYTPPMAGS